MPRKAKSSVSHLLERKGRYYARVVVPKRLQSIVGKTELLEPLGGERALAKVRLHEVVARFHKVLAAAEAGAPIPPRPVNIRRAVHAHYAAELADDERLEEPARPDTKRFNETFASAYLRNLRRIANGTATEADWTDADAAERGALVKERLQAATAEPLDEPGSDLQPRADSIALAEHELATIDTLVEATIGWAVDRACHEQGVPRPKPGSALYREAARALASTQIEVMERVRERDAGNYQGKPSYHLLREPTEPKPPVPIEGLLDTYLAMLAKADRGVEVGKRWRPCFKSLRAFLKHDDARLVTKADIHRWVEHLSETLAELTIRNVYLASIKTVFNYAAEKDVLDANPAALVKVRIGRVKQRREKGFTAEEGRAILTASRNYAPRPSKTPQTRESECLVAAKRWAPILCALTGARIAEMTQLRKEDVRTEGAITYLRLTPEAGSIKTGQYRDVPVHRQLVAEGFLDFVEKSPDGPLFFRQVAGRKGNTHPSKAVSGRVSRWLQQLGIIPEGIAPNHGWRHTFKTVGREVGIEHRTLDAIQGHAARTAGDDYGDVTLKVKAVAIARMPEIPM